MSDDASFSEGTSFAPKNVKKSHFVGVFFLILLVVIVMLLGLYFWGTMRKSETQQIVKPKATPTQTVSPTPTQTPTPTPEELKRSSLQLAVLNGSGVVGAAQGISTRLTSLGYTIKTIGNADRFDYQDVTVKVKKAKSAYLDLLKKDLTDKTTVVTGSIDDTITTDAQVIVGK